MDIQSIGSSQVDGTAWKTSGSSSTKCAGAVVVQKIGTDGAYLDQYEYYSTKTPQGWYTENGAAYVEKGVVTMDPGEGFVVNNKHGVGARIVLPSPVQ